MRQLAKCECVRWPNCLRPDTSGARGANKALKERGDVKIVENDLALLEEQRTSLQTTLENEISKIKEQNSITNFQIEEFNITPKRTDIYNIKLELLWQEQ